MIERAHGGSKKVKYDFSINLNPLVSERFIKKLISSKCKYAINYPEERAESLVKAVSDYYHIEKDEIVAGNGSIELLYYLPLVLKINRIVTIEPTFCEYRYIARINGITHLPFFSSENFTWDFERLKKILRKGDLLIICNPNNPTGDIFPKEEIIGLIKEDVFVLVDEAFMDFSERDESVIGLMEKYENLFVLKSFTKIFSIAGLRVGVLFGKKNIIEGIKERLPLWNVNGIAIEVTKNLLKDKEIIKKTKKFIKKEKSFLIDEFKKLPVKYFDSYANFLLLKIDNKKSFIDFAYKKSISVRTNSGFLGLDESYIRIAVKRRKENRILIDTFREFYR